MIPVNEPLLDERDLEYVTRCVETGWVSSGGSFIESFEDSWAQVCDRRYGVAVSNGTVALQLAVRILGLGPGDRIVMPAFTIISCALAAIYNDAEPVYVDCDPLTWTMDIAQVEEALSDGATAIMPVHMYGHPVEMDPLIELAESHDAVVIEDAAEAHGSRYRGRSGWATCGSFGEVSTFSFYANKLVTTGEGGMVVLDDEGLVEKARSLRNLAFGPDRFRHDDLGFNFRMTNMQAALGQAQTERFGKILEKKRRIGELYRQLLSDIEVISFQHHAEWADSNYWMFGVVIDDAYPLDSAEVAQRLLDAGVQTRPFFLGLHEQPALKGRGRVVGSGLSVTERLSRRGLYLPSGLGLTEVQQMRVSEALHEVLS